MRTYQDSGTTVEEATQKILRGITLKDYERYDVKVIEEPARGPVSVQF